MPDQLGFGGSKDNPYDLFQGKNVPKRGPGLTEIVQNILKAKRRPTTETGPVQPDTPLPDPAFADKFYQQEIDAANKRMATDKANSTLSPMDIEAAKSLYQKAKGDPGWQFGFTNGHPTTFDEFLGILKGLEPDYRKRMLYPVAQRTSSSILD